jgi:hypothetical protein
VDVQDMPSQILLILESIITLIAKMSSNSSMDNVNMLLQLKLRDIFSATKLSIFLESTLEFPGLVHHFIMLFQVFHFFHTDLTDFGFSGHVDVLFMASESFAVRILSIAARIVTGKELLSV